jgi:hypothetical protein
MVWHSVMCPECGDYSKVSRTPGGATANWREHFIAEHLAVLVDEVWWMKGLGVLPGEKETELETRNES